MYCGMNARIKYQQNQEKTFTIKPNSSLVSDQTVTAYTSYLGPVQLPVEVLKGNSLIFNYVDQQGQDFRVIDAVKNRLDFRRNVPLYYLKRLPCTSITVQDNLSAYIVTLKLREVIARQRADIKDLNSVQKCLYKLKKPVNISSSFLRNTFRDNTQYKHVLDVLNGRIHTATSTTMNCYHTVLVLNMAVDAMFANMMFAEFFGKTFNHKFKSNLFLTVVNVPNLDNAFFTSDGYYLAGNGKDMFLPMVSIDVVGHEISHGVVQNTAGLEYKAESGALNEAFSDIFGTALEFYIYKKLNENTNMEDDIMGEFDFDIGEDQAKKGRKLRNMENPHDAPVPQPKVYKGKYWIDTTDTTDRNDYGGVHANSGVWNTVFFQVQKAIGMQNALQCFYKCLTSLKKDSGYVEAAQSLVNCCSGAEADTVLKCLSVCGLGAISPEKDICKCRCCTHVCERVYRKKRKHAYHPYKRKNTIELNRLSR